MGKRSDFERNPRDLYETPYAGVVPLIPFLASGTTFYEPCAGSGALIEHFRKHQINCRGSSDIEPLRLGIGTMNAMDLTHDHVRGIDMIITNPPWSRKILHPMIDHFRVLRPTWLLIDANWMFTKQAGPFMKFCEKVVTIGRLKWFPESNMTGKDDCAWFHFIDQEVETRFYAR